jgi:hypothetical protein
VPSRFSEPIKLAAPARRRQGDNMKILDIPQCGKLGLQVAQGGRYGQIRRTYVVPANPQTPAQMSVRSVFATNAQRWDTLTQSQRLSWINAAAARQTRTHGGTSGPMTGLQFYQQINANLLLAGQDAVDTPPASAPLPAVAPVGLVITNTGGAIAIKLTCPTSPGENTYIAASAPQKQGTQVCSNFRVLGACPVPAQGSSTITTLYEAKFGAPAVGTKLFVEAWTMVDGYKSVPSKFSAIVPAAA